MTVFSNTHSVVMVKRDMWSTDDLIFFTSYVFGHRVAQGHITNVLTWPLLLCMHPVLTLLCGKTKTKLFILKF